VQGLRDLGYIEGKHILIEFRTTGGKLERRSELAAELVRPKVDLIVADTAGEVTAAKNATATIPIVMLGVADPHRVGFGRWPRTSRRKYHRRSESLARVERKTVGTT
jgi:putative ABC transport system substrate-binding protein